MSTLDSEAVHIGQYKQNANSSMDVTVYGVSVCSLFGGHTKFILEWGESQ